MSNKPVVFVITPFDEDFLALYDALRERYTDSYTFTNAGDLDNQHSILKDIVIGIESADVIIADVTGLNSNVFYELGIAHSMNKKVIIITQNITELPFDIKPYRANEYSIKFYKIIELYKKLDKLLEGAINGTTQFGSPVSDFSKGFSSNEITQINDNIELELEESDNVDENDGFIDFIANIEESMEILTSTIFTMQEDMNQMTEEVVSGTREIERVQRIGGASTATFARNVSRKISKPVDTFASQLKDHVSAISSNWNIIENNYLALLSDDKIYLSDNIGGLKSNVEGLEDTKSAIHQSNISIEGLITSLESSMGFERKLTKAITILINELNSYLSMTNTMASSIERIMTKTEILTNDDNIIDLV